VDKHVSSVPVEFEAVTYSIDSRRTILDRFTLTVNERETIVLVGRSGAGKTTVLKLVNRLLEDPVELRRNTGYVIQEIGLFPHMTVADNVGLVPDLLGWDSHRIEERTRTLLEMVGLPADAYAARRPRQLSGGERQRVGVARALAADPPLLLLDEPFGALDPVTRASLQREFVALMRRLGKAALFVTHDVREALVIGDRIGLLTAGTLDALEAPDAFLAADHPEIRALAEIFEGRLGGGDA
jgi:osmoprotectant transport system ATP-binding protein